LPPGDCDQHQTRYQGASVTIPLARRRSGRFIGSLAAPVYVDLFLDTQCPYSAKTWPIVRQVAEHYGAANICFAVNMMVLSNHRQSWDVTLGLFSLAGDDDERFMSLLDFFYTRQERYFNGAFADRTHNDLKALVADFGHEFDGTSRERIAELMADNAVIATAKQPGRYAALRGVWSTPTIFINDSERGDLGSASALDNWRAIIDPLL